MTLEQQLKRQQQLKNHSSLKVLQIISALSYLNRESSIYEINHLTGLNQSTIHRILQELLECGFVEKNERLKQYALGIEALSFSMEFSFTDYLVKASDHEMTRLNNLTLETIHLICPVGYKAMYIAKKEAQSQIGLRSQVGWKVPLYCTSGGKIILAYKDDKWIENYFSTVPLHKMTEFTISSQNKLYEELKRIRAQGYALDRQEHNPDVICIAAPVFKKNGEVAATIGISAPCYRMSMDKLLGYSGEVVSSAQAISQRLAE